MLGAKRALLVKLARKQLFVLGSCGIQSDCVYNSSGALSCQTEIMRCSKASIYAQSHYSSSLQSAVVVQVIVLV